jgi:hypothetical protein
MNERQPGRLAAVLVPAALAGTMLLAAGCDGGTPAATPRTSTGQLSAAMLDSFAACMRGHGVPDFYFSHTGSAAAASLTSVLQLGDWVAPADISSPQFEAALKSCQHLLPMRPPTAAQLQRQLQQDVRQAACMRAHGYSDYPDPSTQDGHLVRPDLPAGIDTSSPRFQATLQKCNERG